MLALTRTKTPSLAIFTLTLFFLLVYTTVHMVDHVLQYIQTYIMGIANPPALFEGILNASDTTIHLWLNTIEWAAMALLWVSFRESQIEQSIITKLNSKKPRVLSILMAVIFGLLIFQTFHEIDHILQYVQLYVLQYTIDVGAPGLFQGLFSETDRIIHAWINGIIILAIVVLWASFRNCQLKGVVKPVTSSSEEPLIPRN